MSISEEDLDLSGLGIYSTSKSSEYSSPETAANAFTKFKLIGHVKERAKRRISFKRKAVENDSDYVFDEDCDEEYKKRSKPFFLHDTHRARKIKKVQAKKLVKSNRSKFF